jgi:ElaB/YqjD/DUF883 family membrane-anchored ribosome-binding protein
MASHKEERFMETAEEKIGELKDQVLEYKENFVGYVQKNPMTALALAAAAGILIGACWKGMRCKK